MKDALPEQSRESLIQELKELIVSALNLDDVEPDDIEEDQALFGAGLDLDSIDALELVVSLEKRFEIKIGSSEESKTALASINSLADYIQTKRASR